jgi:two-component system cell cycle sensor histidine kinase/response regulator CckA
MKSVLKEEEVETSDSKNAGGKGEGNKAILLVDDEESILEFGKAILEHYGFSTMTAPNGEKALEIFKRAKGKIDMVVLDVNMPGIGGYECLKGLILLDPGVKVVVTSGYSSSRDVQEMLEMGAVGFIAKPFRFEEFVKKLKQFLE